MARLGLLLGSLQGRGGGSTVCKKKFVNKNERTGGCCKKKRTASDGCKVDVKGSREMH